MPEIDGQHFDTAMLACRAVRPQDYDEYRKALWNRAIADGLSVPPDYPDRIVMKCDDCGIEVQVGPRQQEIMKTHAAQVFCLICAVVLSQENGALPTVHSLGNPHGDLPKE